MELGQSFLTPHYQRHNQRRQEHLASLGLPLAGKSVLEVGAGIGDHTSFFIDRQCTVVSTDGRQELLEILQTRYPQVVGCLWDVESPPPEQIKKSQIVYAYGLLYHTKDPKLVLGQLASLCSEILLLETCVSFGTDEAVNLVTEADDPTQALAGTGCRPTRSWIFKQLRQLFPYVYLSKSQPWHEEFPIDWVNGSERNEALLSRSVFVAANIPLSNINLSMELLDYQERQQ